MKKIVCLLIASILILVGCSSTSDTTSSKIQITTTVDPLHDMAQTIGGDKVEVQSVYPQNVDIHSYELTSKDMQKVVESDLFFFVSYTSDLFVKDLENSGTYNAKFINVSEHEDFKTQVDASIYNEQGLKDPHIWISPQKNMLMAEVVKNELCLYDQENCEYYTTNYEALIDDLVVVDQMYKDFASTQTHTIITSHEAFNYLATDYGIEIQSVYGISHESEPTSKEIQGYIDYINENDIQYIYVDSNDMENKVMLQIQNDTGCEILPIYNLEANDEAYFIDVLTTNIESMAK